MIFGSAIGYVDSRTTWDDAGITAAALVVTAGLVSVFRPRVWWSIGIVVGLPVVIFNVSLHRNWGASMALVFSVVAAAIGGLIGRARKADRIST
jgi:uncharacterized membrane protein (UPF0136 family)